MQFSSDWPLIPPTAGCGLKGNMTVPTLIMIGELDDWTPAEECRNMVEGRDDWGISRAEGQGRSDRD